MDMHCTFPSVPLDSIQIIMIHSIICTVCHPWFCHWRMALKTIRVIGLKWLHLCPGQSTSLQSYNNDHTNLYKSNGLVNQRIFLLSPFDQDWCAITIAFGHLSMDNSTQRDQYCSVWLQCGETNIMWFARDNSLHTSLGLHNKTCLVI